MKKIHLLSAISLALAITACGSPDENQDVPSLDANTTQSDVVIPLSLMNGYVANALVWVDFRENGAIDGSEPFAFSDNEGFVSFNPNTGVNYCASSEQSLQRYCLRTGVSAENYIIKAAKGIELFTGESFKSVLTTNLSSSDADTFMSGLAQLGQRPEGDASDWLDNLDANIGKLSIFTSIKHYLPTSSNIVDVLQSNGVDLPINLTEQSLLSYDYIARLATNEAPSGTLFETEVTLGRMVDFIALNLDAATSSLDMGLDGLPISNADLVVASLAKALSTEEQSSVRTQTSFVTNAKGVITESIAQGLVDVIFDAIDQDASSEIRSRIVRVLENDALEETSEQIIDIANAYFEEAVTPEEKVTAQQITTIITSIKPIIESSSSEVEALKSLAEVLTDPDNSLAQKLNEQSAEVTGNLEQNELSSIAHDIAGLAQSLVEQIQSQGTEGAEQVIESAQLQPLAEVDDTFGFAGKYLSISGVQDGNEFGQVVTYFTGESQADDGELIMCISYQNPDDATDNILGERFVGNWSEVGSETRISLVAEGLTVQMKLLGEIDGRDIPSESQLPGVVKVPGEIYGEFSFTLNEDSDTWYSDNPSIAESFGLFDITTVPQTDEACQQLLTL
ncbi:MAG: hypothetical protein AAGJ37_00825 [Pseudomonadota bacterium]